MERDGATRIRGGDAHGSLDWAPAATWCCRIHVHPRTSKGIEDAIDAYSCLRVPRFAIRRSAVRAA